MSEKTIAPPGRAVRLPFVIKKLLRPAPPPERWIVFEQGQKAHELRADDLFSAERTLCGKPALDADYHPLPRFNSFPADSLLCRVCCVLHARSRRF